MAHSTQEQPCFPPVEGLTVRGSFDGGALSSAEDEAHGRQERIFYSHHYGSHCHLPLFIFEGLSGKLVTAAPRPGKRPAGAATAISPTPN